MLWVPSNARLEPRLQTGRTALAMSELATLPHGEVGHWLGETVEKSYKRASTCSGVLRQGRDQLSGDTDLWAGRSEASTRQERTDSIGRRVRESKGIEILKYYIQGISGAGRATDKAGRQLTQNCKHLNSWGTEKTLEEESVYIQLINE